MLFFTNLDLKSSELLHQGANSVAHGQIDEFLDDWIPDGPISEI